MTTPRLFLILLIFGVASLAWLVLGQTVSWRTQQSRTSLGRDVARMFGPRLEQQAPGLAVSGESRPRPPDASLIDVAFEHEDRSRGLVWFSVYRVRFEAAYTFDPDPGPDAREAVFQMLLPEEASIDALDVRVGDEEIDVDRSAIKVPVELTPGAPLEVRVSYATAGQDAWEYLPLTEQGGLRDFRLTARTNFADIDYPAHGMSPTVKAAPRDDGQPGVQAEWAYEQMLPARSHTIGVVMPSRPEAGALSARISLFAPVSLFFFFVVMVVIQVLRGWKLHPMNYLLIAAGFFAFHILLAYLVDHVPLQAAFWISAVVSVGLVVSYLRLALGARSAIAVAGAAQLVYLVFFSYAFFWEGWTGLTVVIGAVLTLFVIMQLTGRIDWEEKLKRRPRAPTPPPVPAAAPPTES